MGNILIKFTRFHNQVNKKQGRLFLKFQILSPKKAVKDSVDILIETQTP